MQRWEQLVYEAVHDPKVQSVLREGLEYGYGNLGLPNARVHVNRIFEALEKADQNQIAPCFDEIRSRVNNEIIGRSAKDWWADYYQKTEAPFIVSGFANEVIEPEVLEVGTGRGYISAALLRARPCLNRITQTDVADYRIAEVSNDTRLTFIKVTQEDPLPFGDQSFDTVIVVYVLHHHPEGAMWRQFVQNLGRVTKKRLIILEDSLFDDGTKPDLKVQQAPLWKRMNDLNQKQRMLTLAFQCTFGNKVDGGGDVVPAPCTFKSQADLLREFAGIFPKAKITARFLGIPKTKVYLNPESLFVIEFT